MRLFFIISFFSYCFITCLFAQNKNADTVYILKEVNVNSIRIDNFSSGKKNQKIDSNSMFLYNNNSLSELLSKESPIFIKSYGNGSLATSSFRGGNAMHTAVLWNGFNINNVASGQFDFSLIPLSFANNITIQYGGESALWGSGAVGGSILLTSSPAFNKGIAISGKLSAGSFNNYFQNLNVSISNKKSVNTLKIFNHFSENSFSYYNTAIQDTPLIKQRHAAYRQYGVMSENFLRLNKQQEINFCLWYQRNNYEIPPTMLQENNFSDQNTEILRITSEWKKTKKIFTWTSRGAYFAENLLFTDKSIDFKAVTKTNAFIGEAETKVSINSRNQINIGLNNTYSEAFSDAYTNYHKQNRTAIFASYRFDTKKKIIQNTISVRQEMIKNITVPFTFSVGTNYYLTKWLSAKSSISKIYRLPTLNDLYWNPGGNPELKPEKGYCEEAGFQTEFNLKKIKFVFEPTVFNRIIENWIIWLPANTYWSPVNLAKVQSQGMETKTDMNFTLNKLLTKLSINTNYVISANKIARSSNDNSVEKQLIYVPMYSGFVSVSFDYKGFLFYYHHGYTGYRYTSSDNTEYLNPFLTADMFLGKKTKLNSCELSFFIKINNLFNEKYQVISNRAMPLRNYNAGISLVYLKPKK